MKFARQLLFLLFLCPMLTSAQQKLEIFFDFDRYDLNDEAIKKLNSWMAVEHQIEVVKIYGFCDWKGSNAYNDSLSIKRVFSVYNYLMDNNIEVKSDYEIKGFGENFEQSKIQDENRKVMIAFNYKKDEKPERTDPSIILSEKVKKSKKGDKIKLENINFFNMSPRMLPQSKTILADLLCVMQDNPTLKIEIQGHICCRTNGDPTDLSTLRAKAIYNYLASRKIHRNRLSYKGYGVTQPLHPIPEETQQQQDENRRVEIMIVDK